MLTTWLLMFRAQYERAVGGCGREWKSDKLWDHYVKWEVTISKINVLKLYDRILKNQTQVWQPTRSLFSVYFLLSQCLLS